MDRVLRFFEYCATTIGLDFKFAIGLASAPLAQRISLAPLHGSLYTSMLVVAGILMLDVAEESA